MKIRNTIFGLLLVVTLCLTGYERYSSASVSITSPNGGVGTFTVGTPLTMDPYAASTTVSASHGFATYPSFILSYLECKTAEYGFSIGDRIYLESRGIGDSTSASGSGPMVSTSVSTMTIQTGIENMYIINQATHTTIAITAGNWKMIAVPYRIN